MKSTQASIYPAEHHSVSLNQSILGVSSTKLALQHRTTLHKHTHLMNQCQQCVPTQGILSVIRVEVVGCFWEQITLWGLPSFPATYNSLARSQHDVHQQLRHIPTCVRLRDIHRHYSQQFLFLFACSSQQNKSSSQPAILSEQVPFKEPMQL